MTVSLERTRTLAPPAVHDFVYAVAEIWLRAPNARYLVASESETGNAIETLKSLSRRFRHPNSVVGIEKLVERGGLAKWMRGYWRRLNDDSGRSDDEVIYDLLFPLCAIAERDGYIAIYEYDGAPTFEVATQSGVDVPSVDVWCEFDQTETVSEVSRLLDSIASDLKRQRTLH